uniref:Uncharacterized protein n=1 Tax=Anopheles albimanus TaxID=7167 RepID=A0A182FX18_ANOAL
MGTVASNNRYLFIAICLLLGNFVIFHDRERLVLAEVVGDASVLEHEDNSDTSFKGHFEVWDNGKQHLGQLYDPSTI